MNITRGDLDWAVSQNLLAKDQSRALWTALEARDQNRPGFGLIHLPYYLGAVIVISAMTWFMTEAWERYADAAILVTATVYGVFFWMTGHYLWLKPGLKTPGGLLYALAVCMTPLVVYALERLTGIWPASEPGITQWYVPEVRMYRYVFEVATIAVGLFVLRSIRFPVLTVPVLAMMWGLTLDVMTQVLDRQSLVDKEIQWTAICFGLVLMVAAFLVDRVTKEDYGFWIYLGGAWAFWLGLTSMESDTELGKLIYCMINVALVLLSMLLARRVFFILGAAGILIYLGHLASLFADSLLFPVALSVLGIGIIVLSVLYQRNQSVIEAALFNLIPDGMKRLLPGYTGPGCETDQ